MSESCASSRSVCTTPLFPKYIQSAENFLRALRRLAGNNEGIQFDNVDSRLRIMLRHDPTADDDDDHGFELAFVYCEEKDPTGKFATLLEFEHGGYFDDDNGFVFESFEIPRAAVPSDEAVRYAAKLVDDVYHTRICPCDRYLIKDAADLCVHCELTATVAGIEKSQCGVCHEDAYACHAHRMTCCSKRLHTQCLERWKTTSQTDPCCPFCRAAL